MRRVECGAHGPQPLPPSARPTAVRCGPRRPDGAPRREGAIATPELLVEPPRALVDAPLRIAARGLTPGTRCVLRARSDDFHRFGNGNLGKIGLRYEGWSSWATFVAGADGQVDPSRDAPRAGTYRGVDPVGLLWSMAPAGHTAQPPARRLQDLPPMRSMHLRITLEVGGVEVAAGGCERCYVAEDARVEDVTEDGLVGRLFSGPSPAPRPGVLVLGGSDASLVNSQRTAALLAAHGFAALALAYYGMEGLPPTLEELPLEYVGRAAAWLRRRAGVDARRLAIFGKSKGAELTLMAASRLPGFQAVVASVPSPISWEGLGPDGRNGGKTSWSLDGQPLPFVPLHVHPVGFWFECLGRILQGKPIPVERLYLRALRDEAAVARAFAPVEQIDAPLLLTSSSHDYVWASERLATLAEARLRARRVSRFEHVRFRAGHFMALPHEPIMRCGRGLSGEDIAAADRACWARVLAFLGEMGVEGGRGRAGRAWG
jgi:dienelactone hydrolase